MVSYTIKQHVQIVERFCEKWAFSEKCFRESLFNERVQQIGSLDVQVLCHNDPFHVNVDFVVRSVINEPK